MKAILTRFVAWETLQLTFVTGAIAGMLIEAVMMVALMNGFSLAQVIGELA